MSGTSRLYAFDSAQHYLPTTPTADGTLIAPQPPLDPSHSP